MTDRWRLIVGDCRAEIPLLEAGSVDCIVTSPPYWGMRNYGADGQIGLEASPEEYIAELVSVFAACRRVLRADGTLWINLGDTYVASRCGPSITSSGLTSKRNHRASREGKKALQAKGSQASGLKKKDMVALPWRLGLALQADGWFLRSDIIWEKPSPVPESVRDRPTKSHEYILLLAKSRTYFYDANAISEPVSGTAHPRGNGINPKARANAEGSRQNESFAGSVAGMVERRNARSVWRIAQEPFVDAHYATFPRELARRCIRAGCRPGGLVLDPFNGAGTTGVVAMEEGRRYLGIEITEEYAAMARRRIVEALAHRGEASAADAEQSDRQVQLGLLVGGDR